MGSGERRLWARSAHRSRPRRRFGYFAAAGKVTRRPQTAELLCEAETETRPQAAKSPRAHLKKEKIHYGSRNRPDVQLR